MAEGKQSSAATSEHVTKMLEDPEFRPKWTNRRKVIFISLSISGAIVVLIALTSLFVVVHSEVTGKPAKIPSEITGVMTTLIWSLILFATTIIGAYVFGANFDHKNFRSSFTELAGKIQK